ncbi:cadmium-translocating P-type ATPase [Qipengyuania xiapuensis]|uniref:Cadmium-translocating P-type ATPase n=1 Tax=Qipengyuania xiapuensis TaxID=2867236 RepID=A0ABX8ZW11_9SPHN|nr:heavy metal translocating P-type ATPase [Qipengyuania xiapuensis]QZD93084.1 cadmium-translocating P-type ATPase [Qipengyuania xiapuensis]
MNAHATLAPGEAHAEHDTRFTVPGIRCAGCIAKIERGLSQLEGVEAARVNFSAKRVAVRHDERWDEDSLILELAGLGFEAQPAAENPLAQDDKETRRLLRALAVAGFGMMNIMLLSVSVWSGAGGVTRELFHWLSALIALPVVAYSGRPFFSSALMALRHGRTNMDVPISIGVLLATIMSFHETVVGGEHAYFDGAVMLLFFLLTGRALDATMRGRTRAGIGALLSRMGKYATVVQADGSTSRLEAKELAAGMTMLVPSGEALAADGRILEGQGRIDNSMLTGESMSVAVSVGDTVHAGAILIDGPLVVEVTAANDDTVLAEIARLMDEAGQSRSRYVRIADRASRFYAPAVHTLALLAFAGWMLAGAGWHQSMIIAIAVLIITCPCALGLAVPAAQVVASGALSRAGVLVKDGSALERLAEVDIALFDKTGTLTLGEPVPDLSALDVTAQQVALGLAQASAHPLSRGLAAKLRENGVIAADITEIDESAGVGIRGIWQGTEVRLHRGSEKTEAPGTELRIGDRRYAIGFADELRADAKTALATLSELGISSRILSGDTKGAVEKVASKLRIEGFGGVRPEDKLAMLEELKTRGHKPLMVGDGLNDGPALAAAHASIAPGTASDISQQAADAVFLGKTLAPVATAVRASRRTMAIVRQNFAFAIIYNVLAVPLALAGMVTPLIAAICMSLSSLIVVANSLRLARAAR